MKGKEVKSKSIFILASALSLAACQSTPHPDYTYQGKNLQPETVKYLIGQEFSKRTSTGKTELKYINDGSYLELKETIDPGFVSISNDQSNRLYNILCGETEDYLVNFVKDNGIGIKIVIKGGRSDVEVGPWSSDIC
ncbi:hypothetical protein CW745_12420 [Psychromonas sp. psych-6C06]|uniref:hypothetical protein n=1 Tax=Psychromonas sp. psych-6C06 TaxID=2058089 RepID=UPI000C32DCB6|nr:hypothetical protein [Psychromonas sp. psych-6C06]PKF61104.1 hypothetical protein CW745_12420 [Psychromonas sp. psych-6C06]